MIGIPMPAFGDVLELAAADREALHADHASSRPLSENYELIGLLGEAEFARVFNQPLDLNRRPGGDHRTDFKVPMRMTVDVKTARKPFHLIEEQGKVSADIYVLAQYHDDGHRVELLGWQWGSVLARAPVKDFGHGIINHFIPRSELKPISALERRIMRLV